MLEQLQASKGKKVVLELVNGRLISGTILTLNQQNLRMETDDGICILPVSAVQIIWENINRSLTEENMKQMVKLLRSVNKDTPAGSRQQCYQQFQQPCYHPYYQCYQQYQYPCYHQFYWPCYLPFHQTCYGAFQQPCYYPFGGSICTVNYYCPSQYMGTPAPGPGPGTAPVTASKVEEQEQTKEETQE